jgi:hypothetical protein
MTRKYWDRLLLELKAEGNLKFDTWGKEEKAGSFYARAAADRINVEGKSIKGIRNVSYDEFERVTGLYNDFLDDAAGVKQKMRQEGGYNTPYILTFIHWILERMGDPAPEEPVPVKKDYGLPEVKHYKSRRR